MFSGDGITVAESMHVFGITRPTVTRRLEGLAATGLLQREKRGRAVHYQIDLETLAKRAE
jgi:Fic family protein